MVKVGQPTARSREAAALGAYQRGAAALDVPHSPACRVLAEAAVGSNAVHRFPPPLADPVAPRGNRAGEPDDSVALLLERVVPGYDLRPLARQDDDAATAAVGQVITAMHAAADAVPVSAPADLPALRAIAEAFDPPQRHPAWPTGERPPGLEPALVDRARALLAELTAPSVSDTVLHGDLHHANIVCDGGPAWRGADHPELTHWRAIDPHGWFGDAHFDAVSMLLDLHGTTPQAALGDGEVRALTRRRAAILADITGLDADRIEAWAVVGAVISELWCLADHGFVQGPPRRLAALLQRH